MEWLGWAYKCFVKDFFERGAWETSHFMYNDCRASRLSALFPLQLSQGLPARPAGPCVTPLLFPFQLQDAETSDQLKCFRIITKPKRGQTQASERRVRVRVRRRGAEDWWVPHQAEKEHSEERSLPWVDLFCASVFFSNNKLELDISQHFVTIADWKILDRLDTLVYPKKWLCLISYL